MYSPYRSSKYIKHKLTDLKGERGKSTIIVGDCNLFFLGNKTRRQKINKDIDDIK